MRAFTCPNCQHTFIPDAPDREARRLARVQARATALQVTGKRCSACWHIKPLDAYGACVSRGDGKQSACNDCLLTQRSTVRSTGSLAAWYIVRDALRALPAARQAPLKTVTYHTE